MKRSKIPNWIKWDLERDRFKHRESEGYWQDYRALELHIAKLEEVAPKDSVGWLHGKALSHLLSLQEDLNKAKAFSQPVKMTH